MSGLQPNAVASSSTSSLVPPFSAMAIPSVSPPTSTAGAGDVASTHAPAGDILMDDTGPPAPASETSTPAPTGPPLADLVDLYKRTHDDFYAVYEPCPLATRERDRSYLLLLAKPANNFHSALFDPEDDMLVIDSDTDMPGWPGRAEDSFLGGGDVCADTRDAVARDFVCVTGRFGPKEWSSTKVSEPTWPEGKVEMEPPYVFARPTKRSVSVAEEKVMTYWPTFSVIKPDKQFHLQTYVEMYEEVEDMNRPEPFPLIDCICYEYLNRVLHVHPDIDFKYLDSLGFLPLRTHDITNLPLHSDMIAFPFPNPSSERFPAPPTPQVDGQNAKHWRVDERWSAGETTYKGVLHDSEHSFCPLPSCGEYDCQIHTAHWDGVDSYVTPKDKGGPLQVIQLFLKVGKKGCGPSCFTKHLNPHDKTPGKSFNVRLTELVNSTPRWSDDEIEQLMVLVQGIPNLLPCQMVDTLVDHKGLPKYTCLEYFIQRCKIMDLVEPRRSQTVKVTKPRKGWQNKRNPIDSSPANMRPTRPCNHEGPCSIAQCECYSNKVYCTPACHCSEKDCTRRFTGCSCKNKGQGKCGTKSCKCYQENRECDPYLCGTCGARDQDGGHCPNVDIQQGRSKRVRVGPSTHGLGLFVAEGEYIHANDFIIEYVGDVISEHESGRRGQIYEVGFRNYQFDLNYNTAVDAFRRGNDSRFINQPDARFRRKGDRRAGEGPLEGEANCWAKVLHVLGQHRIGLYATHDIPAGTELLFDYGQHFDPGAPKPSAPPAAQGKHGRGAEPVVYRSESEDDFRC